MTPRRPVDTTPSTSRCSATAPSTTTAGARSARGPARRSPRPASGFGQPISSERLSQLDATGWELYHVAEDPAETHDLAAEHRDRLIAMIALWYVEAGRNGVLPIDGSGLAADDRGEAAGGARPGIGTPTVRVPRRCPFFAGPRVLNRPHSITASVEIPEGGAEGVLLAQGSAAGGYSLFIKDGRLRYVHNWVGREIYGVTSEGPVPVGSHELRFEFEPTGKPDMAARPGCAGPPPALRRRHARRRRRGSGDHARSSSTRVRSRVGLNVGSPVTPEYASPFRFTGTHPTRSRST